MTFDFTENYFNDKTGWGTYFGLMFVLPNEERKFIEYPGIRKITQKSSHTGKRDLKRY